MIPPDWAPVLEPIISAFNGLVVPYQVGGSLASSAWGLPRSTQNAASNFPLLSLSVWAAHPSTTGQQPTPQASSRSPPRCHQVATAGRLRVPSTWLPQAWLY